MGLAGIMKGNALFFSTLVKLSPLKTSSTKVEKEKKITIIKKTNFSSSADSTEKYIYKINVVNTEISPERNYSVMLLQNIKG